jgi:hypothetical protein
MTALRLGKATKEEFHQIVDAKNQAERQAMLNLQLAKSLPRWHGCRDAQANLAACPGGRHRDKARRE